MQICDSCFIWTLALLFIQRQTAEGQTESCWQLTEDLFKRTDRKTVEKKRVGQFCLAPLSFMSVMVEF